MSTTKFCTDPVTGPVTFDLDADDTGVFAEITIDPDAVMATAELSGPTETTNAASVSMSGRTWRLRLPRTGPAGPTVVRAGRGVTVVHGAVTSMVAGTVVGSVTMTGGRVLVDGVDITAAAGPAAEPVRLAVRLPCGSSLTGRASAGQITTRGELAAVALTTTAADIDIDIAETATVRTISGDIHAGTVDADARLRSTSGDIRLAAAGGPVTAETVSGDIAVCAAEPVTIDASSVSGDIDATACRGVRPDVRARSVSGHVRTH